MSPLPLDDKFRSELSSVLMDVASSSHLTEGKYTALLEEEVSNHTGLHAVAVNSCGSGLFALYRVLGVKDAVVPTNTFYATGGMAREAGAKVRLADTALDRFSMGVAEIGAARDYRTDTVVLTHVGGKMADEYLGISTYCKQQGLILIEDAAHALGVPGIGLMSDAAVFSLYPTKAVPVGEGGIVVTRDKDLADAVRVFRNYGKSVEDGVIRYSGGFNLRMDEWTAAVGYMQMRRIADIMDFRYLAAAKLMQVIDTHPEFTHAWSNWYKYPVLRADAERLGITRRTGPIYQVSDQLTTAMYDTPQEPLPNAAKLADEHVCLPIGEDMYDSMSPEEIGAWLRGEEV